MIHRWIANIVGLLPENLVWIFSRKYIAGKFIEDAVDAIKTLNNKGICTTIDVLGEYIENIHEAIEYKEGYLQTIDIVKSNNLNTTVSVKPSMFGLLLDKEFCYKQLREVVLKASKNDIMVCLDMEDSSCTDAELDLFERLYKEFPGSISLVLQAYLKRTLNDLKRLSRIMLTDNPINIRICKGIYIEPKELAYQSKNEIRENYLDALKYMLNNGFYAAIATHDRYLIQESKKLLLNKQKDQYEFQMLYGVRPELRRKIVNEGHSMRIYIPYGTHWYNYSVRRLKENPRMVSHIIKSLVYAG